MRRKVLSVRVFAILQDKKESYRYIYYPKFDNFSCTRLFPLNVSTAHRLTQPHSLYSGDYKLADLNSLYGPQLEETTFWRVPNEVSDQPAHPRFLISLHCPHETLIVVLFLKDSFLHYMYIILFFCFVSLTNVFSFLTIMQVKDIVC